jgi:type I restriction-modification system DNA methylase subunit/REP element-mobilizing transposase RayT
MSLFQKSVEKKYLNEIESSFIDEKFNAFQTYFGNTEIQENICNSKEEQFQEGFLRELFVKILDYTLNPEPNFNLTTELKNIANAKKADGAILKNDNAIAVIELKSTSTTDLDSVEDQAFGYKNHHPKCIYVVTSNFEKLRFYIQNAVEYIEFDLFNLSKENFALMWLCLSKDNILKDVPLKIKESSVLQEENVTKKLYADYSKFRESIFENIVKNNSEINKLQLFKKTQKLLDRFLFVFFAEDRLLLPPNSISEVVKQWTDLKDKYDEYFPLYDRFKKYFGYMNSGYKGKQYDIYPYNGGLFVPDDVLDSIKIDDDVLYEHTLKLSTYDFETEVDVNILGHIFEHSLGEIENVQAEIQGQSINKQKSKRKKDGIFYTPKYITKYIVENTVGKLCVEKRKELEIVDEDFTANRNKSTKKKLIEKLDNYREWLLSLTILDPACGSGAFLNQALDFLVEEHHKIDALKTQLLGGGLIFSDIETDILEKNIYGVDLNEESVEIAKLSLWLRTARKGRKLNTLSNNIKCGNSLIDDPDVAGEKAFNWYKEFPNIFREKEKKAWHVTTATHNSRYSQRMYDNHVKLGDAVWLSEKEERVITETLAEIVEKDKLDILAYNICGDHLHLLLVCEKKEVSKIVGKIKSMTARACNIAMGRTVPEKSESDTTRGQAPLSKRGITQSQLWTQKFGWKEIQSERQLYNTLEYIQNNRQKHELPEFDKRLHSFVERIICTYKQGFRTEYKGGFDVVIGNPPYAGRSSSINDIEKEYVREKFNTCEGKFELYQLFIEKCFLISKKKKSFVSLITPQTWLSIVQATKLRALVLNGCELRDIVFLGKNVFSDASVDTIIFTISVGKINTEIRYLQTNHLLNDKSGASKINYTSINKSSFIIPINSDNSNFELLSKILNKSTTMDKIGIWSDGVKIVGNAKKFAFQDNKFNSTFYPMFIGKDIEKYCSNWGGLYCCRDKTEIERHNASDIRLREEAMFKRNKILIRKTGNSIVATLDKSKKYYEQSLFSFGANDESKTSLEYILALLNSKLANFLVKANAFSKKETFPQIRLHWLKEFPIKIIPFEEQKLFIEKVETIVELISEFNRLRVELIELIKSKYDSDKPSVKLLNWNELEYKEFLKELSKAKIKLSLSEESEWMNYFKEQKQIAIELKTEIDKTDKEIDQMVYQLYGLTEEEIQIVENSI